MVFAGVNYWAVVAAAVVSWLFGAVWYGLFAKPWMAAHGWASKEEMMGPKGKPSPAPFVIAFIAELVMGWTLAGVIGHMGKVSVRDGLISAFFVWFGFVLTTMAVNHGYAQKKPALTMIDGGHWLGVLLIQGIVIGLIGV